MLSSEGRVCRGAGVAAERALRRALLNPCEVLVHVRATFAPHRNEASGPLTGGNETQRSYGQWAQNW